ncbi:hypothetical protein [Chryseobacterium sp. ISL-6]|uniref:hypothetical protein n=1 Tax=Chryseobacterium sp. ISL-6 TaxID=2819143 RepID=UPI001BE8E316|nr:hypothetical protein [Chryseobacterium sp. ISL-6]MBT2623724.1 hypothetical protein [Chryseobacterium sp. ISL-6]
MKEKITIQFMLLTALVICTSSWSSEVDFLIGKEEKYSKKSQAFSSKKQIAINYGNGFKIALESYNETIDGHTINTIKKSSKIDEKYGEFNVWSKGLINSGRSEPYEDCHDPELFAEGDTVGEISTDNYTMNPCQKMKIQNADQIFRNKVSELDKQEIFNNDQEIGVAAAYGTQVNYEYLTNATNDNLKFPEKYFGYIHTHLDSKDGVVKIFSPSDISTFLTTCVRNAAARGTMSDAFGMVITSQGNYILKYSGDGNYNIGPGTLKGWESWYRRAYDQLSESELDDSEVVEKLFTQFLEEKVKIDGLEVYKSDKTTGNTRELKYDGNKKSVKLIPCPA